MAPPGLFRQFARADCNQAPFALAMGCQPESAQSPMNSIMQRRERKSRFTLGRAIMVAVGLHVLFGALITAWPGLLRPAELMAAPENAPIQFNFVDTPQPEPPPEPPETNVLSDLDRLAADNAEPTEEATPFSEGNTPQQVFRPAELPSEASDASELAEPTPEQPEVAEEAAVEPEAEEPDPAETTDAAEVVAANEVTETATEEAEVQPTTPLPPRQRNLKRSLARPEVFVNSQIYDNRRGGVDGERAVAEFDTRGYDLGAYLNEVLRKIERNWHANMPPLLNTGVGGATFVNLSIRRHRNAAGEEVALIVAEETWSSGQPAYDSAAVFALELSNDLPPIPGFFPHDAITGRLGFIYNLDPQEVVFPDER